MMGDQGTDETPVLAPGLPRGVYDDNSYKADNDPAVPHTDNVLSQIIASRPDFHVLAGDIAYADPTGAGKPARFIPSAISGMSSANLEPTLPPLNRPAPSAPAATPSNPP